SEARLRHRGEGLRRLRRGADHRPEGARARDQARVGGRQARRACADRCRDRSALMELAMIETRSSRADARPPLSSRWWLTLTARLGRRLRGDERMDFPAILSGSKPRAAALAVAALILNGAGLGCVETQARAQDAPPGDVINGRSVYLKVNCFQCHGRAGQGGAMNYPAPP